MRRNVFAKAGVSVARAAVATTQKIVNDPALGAMANRGRAELAAALMHQSPAFRPDMGQMQAPRRTQRM